MANSNLSVLVAQQLEEIQRAGGQLTDEALRQLARAVTSAFRAKRDELSILRLSADGSVLHFLYPLELSKIGAIPMTLTHSLAAQTIREKKGEIVNNFSRYKHPTIFESVSLSDGSKAAPIQKIMSVPMIADGKVIGVIQVCRKAKVADPVGPDFTESNLAELTKVSATLAKFLATLPAPPGAPLKHA